MQEIIQNADDARATEVKFILDCRNMQTLPHRLVQDTMYRELSRFSGPALMSYNNASFTKEDWENIQSLHLSDKSKNPLKVGKFGIGFNSVYHLTGIYKQFTEHIFLLIIFIVYLFSLLRPSSNS